MADGGLFMAALAVTSTITGTVTWTEPEVGGAAAPGPRGAVCAAAPARHVAVDAAGRVRGAVVTFAEPTATKPPAPEALEVQIRGCRFSPRVLALGPKSQLTFRSHDPVLHNVTVLDPDGAPIFSVNLVTAGQVSPPVVLPGPGRYQIRSRTGPEGMNAHVWVLEHGPVARTDAAGRFALPDPAIRSGPARLLAWHPDLGVTVQTRTSSEAEVLLRF